MNDTIKITEHIDPSNPGMVTVTLDVDARLAEVTHTMPRVVLIMTLPREAWPGMLGARTDPAALRKGANL